MSKKTRTLVCSLWRKWLAIAKPIGNFQARILFTAFYFVILFIIGLPLRLFSDPLRLHKSSIRKRTNFIPWEHDQETLDEAKKPF